MNLIKYKEEKRKVNKVALANARKEGEDYGAAPGSLLHGSLFLPHFWTLPTLGLPEAPRMGTYLFKTSRMP